MNNVYQDIREMVGNTPILKINHMGVKPGVNVYVKLELMNPAGSVKDRVGEYMIKDAEIDDENFSLNYYFNIGESINKKCKNKTASIIEVLGYEGKNTNV